MCPWDAQGYRGYVGHGRGCGVFPFTLKPAMHNSAKRGGGRGGIGPKLGLHGVGFGEESGGCTERSVTGFNNRWAHEGEEFDERNEMGAIDPELPAWNSARRNTSNL